MIMESFYISAPSIDLRRMVLLIEQYAELKEELLQCHCNPAWTKSGRVILWNVAAICEMGKHLRNCDFGELFKGPVSPFCLMVEYHPISPKDQSRLHQCGDKSCMVILCYRQHVELRVKLYVPTEESFPIPLEYIDVTRTTHTLLDALLEKHIEDFDGVRELSHTGTGFTRFILLNDRPRDGFTWSSERLTRKQTTSRPDDVWPDMWTHMSDAAKKKVKQKWAINKIKTKTCVYSGSW